ncbi:MAG: PaaI family thioesterase [Pseudomonadota bacterium]
MNKKIFEKEIRDKVAASFDRQTFMATLGANIEEINWGAVRISFGLDPSLLQQHGYLHAGVSTAIVDSACGYAALTTAPLESDVLTVEFKTSFLRPASGTKFEARGAVLKPGRRLVPCEGEVWEIEPEQKLIAKMSATMMLQTG